MNYAILGAVLGPGRKVIRIQHQDAPPAEDCAEVDAEVWPDAPFEEAVLICSTGGLQWFDPRDLAAVKAAKWASLRACRDGLDFSPIPVDDFAIDANESSRMDIMGAIMAMQLTGQATREWRCSDNVMRTLTLPQIVSAGVGVAARKQSLIDITNLLSQALDAATTAEQVAAIAWPPTE